MKLILRWLSRARETAAENPPPATSTDQYAAAGVPPPLPPMPPPPLRTSLELAAKVPETGIIGGFMFEAFGASDPGCVRTNNEDYYLVAPSIGLYLVADGMGGAQAGEHASELAATTLWEEVYQHGGSVDEELLTHAFHEANDRVKEAAEADRAMEGMGTTLVAAVEKDGGLLIASVGDSRLYLFEDGVLTIVTEDQTWVNEVGRRLGIEEEQLKVHPMRHVLTMAIGVSQSLRVLTYRLKPKPGSIVLICSDGLHGVALEEDIVEALSSDSPLEEKGKQLIGRARERGGPDNITVVLLRAKNPDEKVDLPAAVEEEKPDLPPTAEILPAAAA